jgi:hypothetical protein
MVEHFSEIDGAHDAPTFTKHRSYRGRSRLVTEMRDERVRIEDDHIPLRR